MSVLKATRQTGVLYVPMADQKKTDVSALFSTSFIGVFLSLIIKSVLDHFFAGVDAMQKLADFTLRLPNDESTTLAWAQLLVFLLLLVRFFLGTLRYELNSVPNGSESGTDEAKKFAINFVFAILVFISFYIASLVIKTNDPFYAALLFIHMADLIWFICASNFIPNLHVGFRRVLARFMLFDLLSLLFLGATVIRDTIAATSSHFLQVVTLIVIAAVSFLDFWLLWPFYSDKPEWWEKV